MATSSFKASIDSSKTVISGWSPDLTAALAAVDADVAVLVADAASPTQAHVTTLNGHLTTLDAAAVAGHAILKVDKAQITNLSDLRKVFAALYAAATSSGEFTL